MQNKLFLNSTLIIIIILSILFSKILTDYGWIGLNTYNFMETNSFVNVVMNNHMSFGAFYTYIDSIFIQILGFNYISVYSIEIIIMTIGIRYLYSFINKVVNNILVTYAALLIFVLFSFTTNIFLGPRTESIYISLLIVMIYYVDKLFTENNTLSIYIILAIVSSLSAISHPNGLLLPLIFGLLLLYLVLNKKLKFIYGLILVVAITILTYHGLLLGRDFNTVFNSFIEVAIDSSHSEPFYHEYKRYVYFFINFSYLIPFYIVSIIGLFKFFIDTIKNKQNYINISKQTSYFILYTLILINLYLIIIGQKHYYYLSLQFFYISFGFMYFIYYINSIKQGLTNLVYSILVITIFWQFIENFKKNSIVQLTLDLNIKKVVRLKNIGILVNNKSVIAPVQLFFFLEGSGIGKYHPIDRFELYQANVNEYDYIIQNIYNTKIKTDKLIFIDTFEYFGYKYNIFKSKGSI